MCKVILFTNSIILLRSLSAFAYRKSIFNFLFIYISQTDICLSDLWPYYERNLSRWSTFFRREWTVQNYNFLEFSLFLYELIILNFPLASLFVITL